MRIANELNVAHIALQINSSIARENLNAMYYPFAMVRETVKSLISFIILLGTFSTTCPLSINFDFLFKRKKKT